MNGYVYFSSGKIEWDSVYVSYHNKIPETKYLINKIISVFFFLEVQVPISKN